jgi:hypothetical protein
MYRLFYGDVLSMRRFACAHLAVFRIWSRVGTKTLFSLFAKTKTFTKSAAVFVKFRLYFAKGFRENFSQNVFAKTLI